MANVKTHDVQLIREKQPSVYVTIKSGDRAITVPETELSGQRDDEFIGLWGEHINNGCYINWQYWIGKMPTLTSQQAARLMCALDPDLFADLNNRPNKNDPADLCNLARDIERLALAAGMATATPEAWVTWGDSNKFKVHWQFRAAIESKQKDAPELAPQPDAAPDAPVVDAPASEPGKALPWWQVAYDIHELAETIGAKLHSAQKRTSNIEIAKGIERRINDIEQSK